MYCKNCKYPVTIEDEYCPNCSELMTEFTRSNEIEKSEEIPVSKNKNTVESNQKKRITKQGKQLIIVGIVLIFLQILSYRVSYERFILDNSRNIAFIIGRNFLFIIGVGLIIKGINKRQ